MRLAFLTHEPFYPPSGGGSAEAVYLVEEFVARGHELHLFCPAFPKSDEVQERFKITLHLFKGWEMGRYASFRNAKYLAYPFALERLVDRTARSHAFDLLFSQHAIAAVTAGRLKKKWDIPVVMNFLDYLTAFMETWPPYLAPPPALAMLKRFELYLPKRYGVDGVLTVSDTLADYFAGTGYPRESILPIYYGYDSELFEYRPKSVVNSPPVIVMHGSLDHHHLGRIALLALKTVFAEKPEVRWKFVGQRTAALNVFMERVRNEVPAAQVECTGFVPYREVAAQLQAADLGMVPYEESTGTHCAFVAKLVEYLGVGLPVVSTRLKSASTYFAKEPTVSFTSFDGVEFGQAILKRLRDPLPSQELTRGASERVRRELDWRAICRKAVGFVESAAENHARK